MPLTLPTHPLAVVPLKLWRPRWFDEVGLVVGTIAPDLAYAFDGYGVTIHSHAWHAPLWWAAPLTVAGARLIRWAAPTVAAHLPDVPRLALRDYGALAKARYRWYVTVLSGIIGAVTHIVWDAFTHPFVDGGRVLFPWLHREPFGGRPWWDWLSTASDLVGFLAGGALLYWMGRHRIVREWHGPAPSVDRRPARFWTVAVLVFVAGLVALPFQPVRFVHDQLIRILLAAVLGLCLACTAGSSRLRSGAATAR